MPLPRRSIRTALLAAMGLLAIATALAFPVDRASAAPASGGGFTTTGRTSVSQVARGGALVVAVDVTATTTRQALVDLEVYDAAGNKVHQRAWDAQSFTAGTTRTFRTTWTVPANQGLGTYTVKVGIFDVGWTALKHWNESAATFSVRVAPTPTTTTVAATTTTTVAATTTTVRPTTTTTTTTTTLPTTTLPTTTTTAPGTPPVSSGGFTTSGRTNVSEIARNGVLTIAVDVTATATRQALVDVEVYDAAGNKVHQQAWDGQSFVAGATRTFGSSWTVPAAQAVGAYSVKVGVFDVGWSALLHWNGSAATFSVIAGTTPTSTTTTPPAVTTTTLRPTTTTAPPAATTTTAAPTPTTVPSARFGLLPPGSVLPSDAECAARVRPAAEIRASNDDANHRTNLSYGAADNDIYRRVTGNFSGTTDEIIQWAACKWGFDEDMVRAQTAKESWWFQNATGDFTSNPAVCVPGHPIGADGQPDKCPESIGLQQVRYQYHTWTFPAARDSSAFNLDYAMAARRNCYEGFETWLNTVERVGTYAAGDVWGCVGLWFSGRWHTPNSETYISDVKSLLAQRIWEQPDFINAG